MMKNELLPNKSLSDSSKLDRKSIRLLKGMLVDLAVNDSQLEEGGNLSNIDGRIELLGNDDTFQAILTVQVKHLTYTANEKGVFYDIPQSIYAYAERAKGEVVLFMACDTINEIIYWTYINAKSIEEFKISSDKHLQKTKRHYFKNIESFTSENIQETLVAWQRLFDNKMKSILDDKSLAERFAYMHEISFKGLNDCFHGLPKSHIQRVETSQILSWIKSPFSQDDKNFCLLTGNAGVGKSVVIKDLIQVLKEEDIKTLSIKADCIDNIKEEATIQTILDAIDYLASGERFLVLIIDQLDSLSQYLTNDRKRLNLLLDVIYAMQDRKNIRIVVSCRKYDLEYDSALRQLQNKSNIIELGMLSLIEVTKVLDQLDNNLKLKLDKRTINILRTAQYLDIFCYIYKRNQTKINFRNSIDLYDVLWQQYLDGVPDNIDKVDVEVSLFLLAKKILESSTLSPIWKPGGKYEQAVQYLCSVGAIKQNGNNYFFFHQTFYDYTLARYYDNSNKSYIIDLEDKFQGLEIRSSVKLILEYERGHRYDKYLKDIELILTSTRIRFHLKFLAISILAYIENPRKEEKRIIKDLCGTNIKLISYFLKGVSGEKWFSIVKSLIQILVKGIDIDNNLFYPIVRTLSIYSNSYPIEVFNILNSIEDSNSKIYAIQQVLHCHNDYNQTCVQEAYFKVKRNNNTYLILHYIKDALQSNPQFAISETEKLIEIYLLNEDKNCNRIGYALVEKTCKNIIENYPKDFLNMFHKCFVKILKQTSKDNSWKYNSSRLFDYHIDVYKGKLLDIYKTLLINSLSDSFNTRSKVIELLSLKNDITLSIAFNTIGHNPLEYSEIIKEILSKTDLVDSCLYSNANYYFFKMLKQWYLLSNTHEQIYYEKYVLSYKSQRDNIFNKERTNNILLMPYLWYDKWYIICNTLPEEVHIIELKKIRLELFRRFGKKHICEKTDYHMSCTTICGGIVSDKIYSTFSKKNWLTSFLKLENSRSLTKGIPVDLRRHADAFTNCIASDVLKWKSFVFKLFDRDDIKCMYKTSALKGLLEGGFNIEYTWDMYRSIVTAEFINKDYFTYRCLTSFFLKEENSHIDKLIGDFIHIIKSPYKKQICPINDDDVENKLSRLATDMLNRGINSPQGVAIELMISLCAINSRCNQIYNTLEDLCIFLDNDLRVVVLQYLYTKEHYKEVLFDSLFQKYLKVMGTEVLAVRADVIQHCYYYKRNIVDEYIKKMEKDDESHNILAQIYFYGISINEIKEECEQRLNAILVYNKEEIIAIIVKLSLKYYSDIKLQEYAKGVLIRFSEDYRKKIRETYYWYCNSLPVEAFPFFCKISKTWYIENKRDVYDELKYIEKCVNTFPKECLMFIKEGGFHQRYILIENDTVVRILLQIYKKLNEDIDENAMSDLMNLFDEYIYYDIRSLNNAIDMM